MDNYLDNLFNLKNKVVFITGGGGLLGGEYIRAFLSCGARVALLDIDGEKVRALTEGLSITFGKDHVLGIVADVSKKDDVEMAVKKTVDAFGGLDVLVNNAAISGRFDSGDTAPAFETYPLKEWETAFAVNITGMFLCAQAAGKRMAEMGGGVIVNVSSIYGIVAPDQRMYNKDGEQLFVKPAAYSVTKSAVFGLTSYLAAYWQGKNIRVNTLTPGAVFDKQNLDFVQKYNNKTPLGRMAKPDDLICPLLFLSSDASKYMTGANLLIDGGWTIW